MLAPDGAGRPARKPDLFIIGAAKAGTTALYEYLSGHPEVYMSPLKEPAFFAPDVRSPRNSGRFALDLDRYLALFELATDEKRVGEASTHYLFSRLAPRAVMEFQPEPRIVAIVRNPVDVAYALHGQRLSNRTESVIDFAAALAADERPDHGGEARHELVEREGTYRDRARFAPQLERWFEVAGRERCHVMVLEEFIARPAEEFRRLLEFLDVDPTYCPARFGARNASYRTAGPWKAVISSDPIRLARHRLLPVLLGSARSAALVRTIKKRKVFHRPARRSALDPGLRRRLESEFAPDVGHLSALLDRDLAALWFDQSA